MKELELTSGVRVLVDDEDLIRLSMFKWQFDGKRVSRKVSYEINIPISNQIFEKFGVMFDHINRNPLDNRKVNLRECTRSQNMANKLKRVHKNHTSKYKGVSLFSNGKFRATILHRRRQISLGYFTNEEDAAKAYDMKAKEIWGEFAVLNFP